MSSPHTPHSPCTVQTQHSPGRIELILGPMFAGKSTELLRRVRRYTLAGKRAFVVKHDSDNRYSKKAVATHDGEKLEAVSAGTMEDIYSKAKHFDVVAIDEGQFFPDIDVYCERLANKGCTVLVAGLDGTYQREAFGKILELVPRAESITKLSAVCCHCGKDAAFSARTIDAGLVEDGDGVTDVGGKDKYLALCRECYKKNEEKRMKMEGKTASPLTEDTSSDKHTEDFAVMELRVGEE